MARPQLSDQEIADFREDACNAALELISETGVAGLTVRSLGQRLGCSYAKPYRYFGDKDQLIDAVRAHAFDHFTRFMSGHDPQSAALLPIQRYVQFATRHNAAFEVMFGFNQAFVSSETRAAEDRAWEACSAPIYAMIEAGQLQGDPQKIAHILWVALHGIATLSLSNKLTHGMNEDEILEELRVVLYGFRPAT